MNRRQFGFTAVLGLLGIQFNKELGVDVAVGEDKTVFHRIPEIGEQWQPDWDERVRGWRKKSDKVKLRKFIKGLKYDVESNVTFVTFVTHKSSGCV